MTTQESKETVRRLIEILNSHDLSRLDEICHDNMLYRLNTEVGASDLEAYKELIQNSYNSFPDLEFTIEELIAEGNKVHMIYKLIGTHKGKMVGTHEDEKIEIPASNNRIELAVSSLVILKQEKIIEQQEFYDSLTLMKQIDAVPG